MKRSMFALFVMALEVNRFAIGNPHTSKKRNPAKVGAAPPVSGIAAATAPRMANLFEEAPETLFDADEDDVPEPEPVPEPPKPIGPIIINGQAAQLVERKALDATRTQYRVVLDSTGELKSFISPPAVVEASLDSVQR